MEFEESDDVLTVERESAEDVHVELQEESFLEDEPGTCRQGLFFPFLRWRLPAGLAVLPLCEQLHG